MFKDAVQPVFSLRRWTSGDEQDHYELNGQLIFFTTSGYRGTDEFIRTLNYVNDMADCKGAFVFGANWELPVHFGLLTKKYVMDIKNDETTSPIAFMQNYESVWVGAGDSALINMDKVQALRSEDIKPIFKTDGKSEYVIAMDVARSESQNNNQSAFVVSNSPIEAKSIVFFLFCS
jgi:ribonucleoside-diphosphate reductase alpha chain